MGVGGWGLGVVMGSWLTFANPQLPTPYFLLLSSK
jgi:hypothetical protein